MKTKIYIAGKITGDPNYKEKFAKMESELLKIPGTTVINPAALPTGLEPAGYARICSAMIDSSDIAVFAPDYKESSGALLEMQYCKYVGKKALSFEEYIQSQTMMKFSKDAIHIVQKWSDEHPVETMIEHLKTQHPKVQLDEDNVPPFCPPNIGYEEDHSCDKDCIKCWNRPYMEEKDI
jgi:hypothetical protein|nr:MAG TPA: 2'-deoxynucleoside 5'-phosphate N-hydrolase 1 [Caudoviricetes sp.]